MKKILTFLFMLTASFPLVAEEQEAVRSQGSFYQTLILIGIAIAFFYFILWRPEQKRRKAMEQKRSSMKKGDKITATGIIGTIDRVKEQTVVVKMIDGAKLEFLKAAITEVKPKEEAATEEQE